jgi:catechol 2,3-dioxygenase-like lactoylglutathione lyase family enzyme
VQVPGQLGDRINHIAHVDVNVTDADRSRRFYEATMPVETVARIEGKGTFPSLGIDDGWFSGYVLRSSTQLGDYPALRLIEWKRPRPVGTPYVSHGNVGWYRLVSTVRDIESARSAVIANGGSPFAETSSGKLLMYGPKVAPNPYRTFHAHDPDGITIQWSYDWPREDQTVKKAGGQQGAGPKWLAKRPVQDRMFALVGGTTDVDRYAPFYTDILGFDIWSGLQTPKPVANIYSPSGGMTVCDGAFFVPRGDRRFVIDWLRWWESADHARPYAEPNHLGIIRCAIEVDDIDRAHECLAAAAAANNLIVGTVHPPETWNMGPETGEQRVVNFTDGEGVMFQLIEAPAYPLGTLHPWGADAVNFGAATIEQSASRGA